MNDGTNKTKLEVLKMARELLNEEYINRRAEDHNRWIAECDVAWKTKGIKLAYPPFAPYPSESEILAKAASLYKFVAEQELLSAKAVPEAPIIDPAGVSPWVTHLSSIASTPRAPIEQPVPVPITPPVVAPTVVQPVVLETVPVADPVAPEITANLITAKPLFATSNSAIPTPSTATTIKSLLPNWLQSKDTNV